MLRTFGDAFEHRVALMGITVHPVARSESETESIRSVVRSSRSSGHLKITTTTTTFSVMFSMITALMIVVFISSKLWISEYYYDYYNVQCYV